HHSSHSSPTRRSSDLIHPNHSPVTAPRAVNSAPTISTDLNQTLTRARYETLVRGRQISSMPANGSTRTVSGLTAIEPPSSTKPRSEEHTSELQSRFDL